MTTYILIHGAWHGGWCWDRLASVLRANGHTVHTPDLPGHGSLYPASRRISASDYIDAVQQVANSQPDQVILLGHSMGGMVISGVAERIPERIQSLVYLGAFMLVNGESINDLEDHVGGSLLGPQMQLSPDRNTFNVPAGIARAALYSDCSETDYQFALARLQPQPVLPFITPISVSERRYGTVPRVYIECLKDLALPLAAQRFMQARMQCEQIFSLDAGHAAFFTRYNELADILTSRETTARCK